MNGKPRCPWLALLLLADGLAALLGGRRALLQLREVAPFSLQIALDGLLDMPEAVLRLAGAAEALIGAVFLAAWLRRRRRPLASR